ncbi:ATP-dependent DNA ligase LigD polymerase module [Desulfitobacterium dehalogenans ATCC 51507]|uniref:DNA ligase (ATP) n=1 Tax=Desulfitobacterium dehalogenans (strain ATCC 51507 / DSM 9161 / JW/IU-DC1) TaxID=756499 RepID=I4A4U0_DESDJ|nr:DNA ligase D [Desulfitobacterium dehalogenans]AFL98974.1 ATP-dependent DNA ligase LigD polymerase module [Desulfitobacterium dehalogenans ATCC 51507]
MTAELNPYNQKRNFAKTLEPEGIRVISQEDLKFVVQHHLARRDHYDLRLEWEGALLSWAVPKGPSYDTRDKRLAVQVEDHPLEYRNFEGTIPKGEYGGGVVMLWDEGSWEPYGDVDEGLREGVLKFVLKGRRLKGKWALVRMKEKAGEKKDNWLLLKEKDEYAQTADGIAELTTSIRTGRTMAEIEEGEDEKFTQNPFSSIEVQLAKLVHSIPEGKDWLYELKYDGYRIVAYIEGNSVRLITRNGHDYTERFRDVASSLLDWAEGRAMILDGEMVVTDPEGKTDFQALQNYLKNPRAKNLTYILFDLLALDGADLRGHSLIDRKETLAGLMEDAPPNLHYSRHVRGKGKESYLAACEGGMEGIIGKKADSLYSGARNGDWIKLKCAKRQEFVIGGYTLSHKKTSGISSLLLGVYEGEELVYAGRAGTGLSEADMKELEEKFKSIKSRVAPFKAAPKPRSNEKITWLEPELVAEIQFAEWTKEDRLRQASFKGLRGDKNPREIQREKADEEIQPQPVQKGRSPMKTNSNSIIIEGIKISSPDKVIFAQPEITKVDVIRYYEKVAERMLPYVSHRVLSIVRCPKGVAQTCFYKKHPGPGSQGIVTIPILTSDGGTEDYFYIENISGLIAEAQMGTLEFHIWGSRVDELEKPDLLVFDLDPDEGMDLGTVRQGVRDIKDILAELSLNSYLKTSGGKGYHVVVPLKPAVSWEVFHDFARGVAQVMEQKWPDRYTSNVRKAKRTNKIFIDWIRNGRGATSIAPYSLRARKGAGVSMPILWEELDMVAPDGVDMAEALRRIEGSDPWQDFFQNQQRLK